MGLGYPSILNQKKIKMESNQGFKLFKKFVGIEKVNPDNTANWIEKEFTETEFLKDYNLSPTL